MSRLLIFSIGILLMLIAGCKSKEINTGARKKIELPNKFLVVLGIVQDAGYPQIGCEKECCKAFWEGKENKKNITCLALVNRLTNQYWLFEATPDITTELHNLQPYLSKTPDYSPDGIFITHAHIGHYAGLMEFGREAMGAKEIPVYAMPGLDSFLQNNGPWSQLVSLKNIQIHPLLADSTFFISSTFKLTPFKVPHRDEFSETAGFVIETEKKKILFIPDIDKWATWNRAIIEEINKVDMAFLDATFYSANELKGRDMAEVPHPFVKETMALFSSVPDSVKSKINFIHFNHTNPLLKISSPEKSEVKAKGFKVAEEGMIIEL